MKKTFRYRFSTVVLFLLAISMLVTGCGKESSMERKKANGKVQVVASFYMMYDLAKKIGGDQVKVKNLVPAGTEPHEWEPGARDVASLEDADVFVYNGAEMEHWTDTILNTLDNKELVVAEASKGVKLTGSDPHVWLAPLNAKKEMENIKDALIKADPKHRNVYEENYKKNAEKCEKLDERYKRTLGQIKRKEVITAHEAFGYLCRAYDLKQIGIEGIQSDSEPDAARMKEIIQFAKKHDVGTIFFEELVSPKVAETIAKEIGAKTAVLDTLEGMSDEDQKAGADYFSVMEENLRTLKKALDN